MSSDRVERSPQAGETREVLWHGKRFVLLSERAMLWPERAMLILSDLHLGKDAHLRRSGIPVPAGGQETTLERLETLIRRHRPARILVVGDLFHSRRNSGWDAFTAWREQRSEQEWVLVRGNHDILPLGSYREAGIEVVTEWREGGVRMAHEPDAPAEPDPLADLQTEPVDPARAPEPAHALHPPPTVCGHLHPGVRIALGGRQKVVLPCFHLSDERLILPAFGELTGLHALPVGRGELAFAMAEGRIFQVRQGSRLA